MTERVTVGLVYDFRNPEPWREPWQTRYETVLDQISWVDAELSLDSVHVTEHHFYEDGYLPSPLLVCAAIAARSRRLAIGTNLVQLPLHHPIRLAEESLVLDVLTGGRFRLGIGGGYDPREHRGLGSVLGQRPSRMVEGIEILRHAFSGESFAFAGRRFDIPEIRVTPPPVRDGGPEIWIGAFARDAMERAVRSADGFVAFGRAAIARYLKACDRLDRPTKTRQINRTYWAIIAEDPERAFAQTAPHFLHLFNDYIRHGASPTGTTYNDAMEARDHASANGFLLYGDADTAITALNRDIVAGACDINLLHWMPGEHADIVAKRVQYLCEKVLPRLDAVPQPASRLTGASEQPSVS